MDICQTKPELVRMIPKENNLPYLKRNLTTSVFFFRVPSNTMQGSKMSSSRAFHFHNFFHDSHNADLVDFGSIHQISKYSSSKVNNETSMLRNVCGIIFGKLHPIHFSLSNGYFRMWYDPNRTCGNSHHDLRGFAGEN